MYTAKVLRWAVRTIAMLHIFTYIGLYTIKANPCLGVFDPILAKKPIVLEFKELHS